MRKQGTVYRGDDDLERLFLNDREFVMPNGERVVVKETSIPGADMRDTIARHKARYFPVGLFCRPDYSVLDFPCGSGYASQILSCFDVQYLGCDHDPVSVEYAKLEYGSGKARYKVGDLTEPSLGREQFHVAACIEGLEHIEIQYQDHLILALKESLVPDGVLVISSPAARSGISGPSDDNPFHLGELTKADFVSLLGRHFSVRNVEVVTQRARLTTGYVSECLYGICRKEQG